MQGLWRVALRRSTKLFFPAAPRAPTPFQGTLISLQQAMVPKCPSASLHLGYKYAIDAPKGVKGERWHKRKVKKVKRKVYSPYTIRSARFYSRQRCLTYLKQQAEREAKEEEEATSARRSRARQASQVAPEPPPVIKRNQFVSAVVPVSSTPKNPEIPEYCKPVVKRIDPWKAPWTPPFKKPRQEYQVGRPRPLSKPLARVVRRDKEAAKAHARERRLEKRFKDKPIRPKQRMEFT